MTDIDYVIVGAEVDEARRFLQTDGSVTADNLPGSTPLTVEFIGKLMVALSKAGEAGLTPAKLQAHCTQVKNALRVRELGGAGAPQLSDAEKDAILAATTVSITFENRETAEGAADLNSRILVVPSDRTLEIAEAALQAAAEKGFRPPLTYDLDRAMMLAHLADTFRQIIAEFGEKAVPGWTDDLQAALTDHFEEEIERQTSFMNALGDPADSVLNDIMHSPIRAFYRSVGIYATNMCR